MQRPSEETREHIEAVLHAHAYPIWIVTAANETERGGLVATWVYSWSIDPANPIVALSIHADHFTRTLIDQSKTFALHQLRKDQTEVAFQFCMSRGNEVDKFKGLETKIGLEGSPVLADCLSMLEGRLISRQEMGDRVLYLADVTQGAFEVTEGEAMADHDLFAAASTEQLMRLLSRRDADIAAGAERNAAWRAMSSVSL